MLDMLTPVRTESEERRRIHLVKHMPKSDEEVLDQLLKRSANNITQPKRANKDAKEQLQKRKDHVAQRDAKCANASDVSEVETVVPTSKFFQLDVNLDTLKDHLRDIRGHLTSQYDHLRKLDKLVDKRATEKVLGLYLKRVANSVPQTVGERPHSFKLDEPGFL